MFYQHLPPYMYYKPKGVQKTDCFSNFECANSFDKIMNDFSETGVMNLQHVHDLSNSCGKKCEYVTRMYVQMAIETSKKQEK